MKNREGLLAGLDYAEFSDPYTGLATMIFVQADWDLRRLGGHDACLVNNEQIRKGDIIRFLRSRWAAILADGLGLEKKDLADYTQKALNNGRRIEFGLF